MEEYSDEMLIQRVLDGDRTAFGILVDRCRQVNFSNVSGVFGMY